MTHATLVYQPRPHRGVRFAAFAIAAGFATALTLGAAVAVPAQLAQEQATPLAAVNAKRLASGAAIEVAIVPARVVVVGTRDSTARNDALQAPANYRQRG